MSTIDFTNEDQVRAYYLATKQPKQTAPAFADLEPLSDEWWNALEAADEKRQDRKDK